MIKQISLQLSILLMAMTSLLGQSRRPQEPLEPFSYRSENVFFENTTDSISLAGTLTWPEIGTNFPAVVLISGSGPQDRNSEILGHKSFLVISDYLTKNGIAVLRVDDRGVGESKGVHNETGLNGFKRDTEYAVDYLKDRKEINSKKIGLIGHSLGGIIAPMIASESNDISFIILLAGLGMRGDKLMLLQKEIIERKMGVNEEGILIGQKNIGGAYDLILKSTSTTNTLQMDIKSHFTEVFGAVLPKNQIDLLSEQLTIPWFTDLIKHDPKETFQKIKCPVLALNGSNDVQVPAKENLAAIEKTIRENGNKAVKTVELPKLNHLFQESDTGLPNEYGTIEQTFSPLVLKIMTDWILEKIKKV